MKGPAVKVENLDFSYNAHPVLENVGLTVMPGEFLAVVGPNGGGKTTLIKLLLGLLTPDRGSVSVFGRPPAEARGRVGYVPQHSGLAPDFPATVREVVLMGLQSSRRLQLFHSAADKGRALAALERVGMAHLAGRRMGELSGGQKQRVLIARALVSEPELLLLDEPTSNIDPHGRFCLYDFLHHLGGEMTIMAVSHDLSVTAGHVTCLAAVNRSLAYNCRPEFTPEMLALVYGSHEHSCPAHDYLQGITETFPPLYPDPKP